jgi:hypothetical protein
MDTVYINTFDTVITTPSLSTTCFGDAPPSFGGFPPSKAIVADAIPNFDSGLWVQLPNVGPVKLRLGEMQAGSSTPAHGSICHIPTYWSFVNVRGVPKLQMHPAGLQVTVCQNAQNVAQSQTLYLVPNTATGILMPFPVPVVSPFVGPGTLTAELVFDSPQVSGGVGDPWAVTVNFKQNGKMDGGPADADFGPTCQFSAGGTVKLNKVDVTAQHVGNYADYQNTTFTLTTSLSVDQAGNASGVASLSFGQTVFSSAVKIPANFSLRLVNAVGVAVVSVDNSYPWVRAVLRKFTLYATPPQFIGPRSAGGTA